MILLPLLWLTVHSLVVDYPASQMGLGWIQIALRSPTLVSIQRVTWCKSGERNNGQPPPPDIAECEATNLLHLQLFPSAKPYLRDPPEAEPNMLYISADDLGGWDAQHQMNIIIVGDKGAFRQVVRFNPLPSTSTTTAATTMEEETQPPPPTTTVMVAPTPEPTSLVVAPTPPPPPPLPIPIPIHPWFGTGLFLGSGLLVLALATALIRWRQIRGRRSAAAGNSIEEVTRYHWDNGDTDGMLIEMVEMTHRPTVFAEDE